MSEGVGPVEHLPGTLDDVVAHLVAEVDWSDVADRLARTRRVLDEVGTERVRQVEAHGFDDRHDAERPMGAWAWLLARRANDLAGVDVGAIDPEMARRLLVEMAAIAVAAIEAHDTH